MMLSKVDLPQPEGPSRQTNSPSLTVRLTSAKAFMVRAMTTEDLADALDTDKAQPGPGGRSFGPRSQHLDPGAWLPGRGLEPLRAVASEGI